MVEESHAAGYFSLLRDRRDDRVRRRMEREYCVRSRLLGRYKTERAWPRRVYRGNDRRGRYAAYDGVRCIFMRKTGCGWIRAFFSPPHIRPDSKFNGKYSRISYILF